MLGRYLDTPARALVGSIGVRFEIDCAGIESSKLQDQVDKLLAEVYRKSGCG
jgi:hypothetical protein